MKDVTGAAARVASTSSSEARSIARAKRSPLARTPAAAVARCYSLLIGLAPQSGHRDSDCAALGGVPVPLFVSFVARQRGQPSRPIAHVDHMRTTSIPSNHGTFTNHLHIRRRRGGQAGQGDSRRTLEHELRARPRRWVRSSRQAPAGRSSWAVRSSSVITSHNVERRLPVRRTIPADSSSRNRARTRL